MANLTYSPQIFNTFIECPQKYYLKYVKKIAIPQLKNHFLIGKNIHALASYFLRGEDISIFKNSISNQELQMWNTLIKSEYFKLKPIKIESNITCKIKDFWISGRIDALVKNKTNEYFVLDYKTGGIPKNAEQNFQTIIYLMCCDQLIQNYNSLNFVYINTKNGEIKKITFDSKLKEEYYKKLIDIQNKITKFSNTNIKHNEKCKNCSFSKICV